MSYVKSATFIMIFKNGSFDFDRCLFRSPIIKQDDGLCKYHLRISTLPVIRFSHSTNLIAWVQRVTDL